MWGGGWRLFAPCSLGSAVRRLHFMGCYSCRPTEHNAQHSTATIKGALTVTTTMKQRHPLKVALVDPADPSTFSHFLGVLWRKREVCGEVFHVSGCKHRLRRPVPLLVEYGTHCAAQDDLSKFSCRSKLPTRPLTEHFSTHLKENSVLTSTN